MTRASRNSSTMPPAAVYLRQDDCEQLIRTLVWVKSACSYEKKQVESIDRVLKILSEIDWK